MHYQLKYYNRFEIRSTLDSNQKMVGSNESHDCINLTRWLLDIEIIYWICRRRNTAWWVRCLSAITCLQASANERLETVTHGCVSILAEEHAGPLAYLRDFNKNLTRISDWSHQIYFWRVIKRLTYQSRISVPCPTPSSAGNGDPNPIHPELLASIKSMREGEIPYLSLNKYLSWSTPEMLENPLETAPCI